MRFCLCNMMTSLQSKQSQNVLLSDSLLWKYIMRSFFGRHFLIICVFDILSFGWKCCIWVAAIFPVLSTCPPQILNQLSAHVNVATQHIRAMELLYHITLEVHLYHVMSIIRLHLHSRPLVSEEVAHFTNMDSTRGPEISCINSNKK